MSGAVLELRFSADYRSRTSEGRLTGDGRAFMSRRVLARHYYAVLVWT